MTRLSVLLAGDGKNVMRDPMLTFLPLIPFVLTLGLRLIVPWLTDLVDDLLDLREYYDFIVGFLLLMTPMITGMLAGFILLDERDEHVLMAIAVTPMGRPRFLLYRTAAAGLSSFVLNLAMVAVIALVPLKLWQLAPTALVASTEAAILALFMGAVAGNKVEGLVLAKASGLLLLAPLALIFLPGPWHLVAGLLPSYWITRSFLALRRPELRFWWSLTAAAIYHGGLLLLLVRLFNRRTE